MQKITPELKEQMILDFKSKKLSQSEIARKYNISRVRVHQYLSTFVKDGIVEPYDEKAIKAMRNRFKELKTQKVYESTVSMVETIKQKGLNASLTKRCSKSNNAYTQIIDVEGKLCHVIRHSGDIFYGNKGSVRGYFRFRKPWPVKSKNGKSPKLDFVIVPTPRGIFVLPYSFLDSFGGTIYIPESTVPTSSDNRVYHHIERFEPYLENWKQFKQV